MLKKEYKKAILLNLKNIEENIDDILDLAFKNSTQSINISMSIEPNELVTWNCYMKLNAKEDDKVYFVKGE